jgi:YfiH family protein
MPEPDWIIPADWSAPGRVRALTTTRRGPGVSAGPFAAFNLGDACGDEPASVARNRAALLTALDLPSEPRWLKQVHGASVVRWDEAEAPHAGRARPQADAAVTARPGTVLAILSADCLPVLLCAEDGSEVGAAHAGWRGLAAGVLEATVAAMETPPDRLLAWLGPAIGPTRYEVGREVRDVFLTRNRDAHAVFEPTRPGHWLCDLYALARQRLRAAGVSRIHGEILCTYGDPERFYSHRRDTRTGRMATLVWID